MKKLVIKTTLITLASLIGTIIIAFSAVAIFAPGFTAGIFDGVGNYSATVFFYQKQYSKTGDINDLSILVNKIDLENDSERAEKYLDLMLKHDDFDFYCDSQSQSEDFSLVEYYCGNYAYALALNGKFDEAISVAENFVSENSYTKNNPYTVLIYGVENLSNAQIQTILSKLNLLSQTEKEKANSDIEYLNQLLG